jgi:hypothetical protein
MQINTAKLGFKNKIQQLKLTRLSQSRLQLRGLRLLLLLVGL